MYPIHVAAQMGDVPILRILLDLGVDPQTGAADGRTARHFAEEANRDGSHSRILQLLAHSQRVKSVAWTCLLIL
jgi:ankyrin repeat protein